MRPPLSRKHPAPFFSSTAARRVACSLPCPGGVLCAPSLFCRAPRRAQGPRPGAPSARPIALCLYVIGARQTRLDLRCAFPLLNESSRCDFFSSLSRPPTPSPLFLPYGDGPRIVGRRWGPRSVGAGGAATRVPRGSALFAPLTFHRLPPPLSFLPAFPSPSTTFGAGPFRSPPPRARALALTASTPLRRAPRLCR